MQSVTDKIQRQVIGSRLSRKLEEVMKKAILFVLMLAPLCSWAEKVPPVPADYTIAVHVQSSRTIAEWGATSQQLSVVIDGKHYEIHAYVNTPYVLRVGDYRARLHTPDAGTAYEYKRIYEILFPDGKTRDYLVVGEEE